MTSVALQCVLFASIGDYIAKYIFRCRAFPIAIRLLRAGVVALVEIVFAPFFFLLVLVWQVRCIKHAGGWAGFLKTTLLRAAWVDS